MKRGNILLNIIPFLCAVFFAAATVIAIAFDFVWVYNFFPMLIILTLLIVLSRSYVIHEKNAMKAALSAVLAALICWECYYMGDYFNYLVLGEDVEADFAEWFAFGGRIASSILFAVIMVFHFLLTSEHKSNPKRVRINTVALMLVVVVFVVMLGSDFVNFFSAVPGKKWWARELSMICIKLFEIAALLEVVRIEMLLDMFRSRREEKARLENT